MTIVYDKLAYCIFLLGSKKYIQKIITINYYQELKYNLLFLKQDRLKLIIIEK